jgi:predicted Zn-ribbon and HTH transcriptional regulator
MPMGGYHQYLVGLARELNTTNMDTIYDHHEAFCARCGVQFTREALAHLDLFGPGGDMFGTVMVVGATREGNDLRSGRCPKCRSMEMRVVTK